MEDFVKRFMPAYRNYLPRLHASGHGPLPRKPTILSSVFTDMNATDDAAKDVSVDMRCPALLIQMNHRRLPTHAWFV